MTTKKTIHHPANDGKSLPPPTLATRFDGTTVTAVMWRGRWCWRGAEVGRAIGYEQGRRLVDKIRGEWSADFRQGKDYDLLRGEDLREFKGLSTDPVESGPARAPSILVLYESGIDMALLLSRTEKGRRLRALLVDHVLPQLRATGTATLPGAPAPETITAARVAAMIEDAIARRIVPSNSNRIEGHILAMDASWVHLSILGNFLNRKKAIRPASLRALASRTRLSILRSHDTSTYSLPFSFDIQTSSGVA